MASEVILETLKSTIQVLARKYEVSPRRVWMVLADIPNEELARLDWKDLDTVVQEGLAGPGEGEAYQITPSSTRGDEVIVTTPEGKVLSEEETKKFLQGLQGGVFHLPQSRGRR